MTYFLILFFISINFYFIGSSSSINDVDGGDGFIQIGEFRIGNVDDTHFSISSTNNQKTSIIFRNDGTVHEGMKYGNVIFLPYITVKKCSSNIRNILNPNMLK